MIDRCRDDVQSDLQGNIKLNLLLCKNPKSTHVLQCSVSISLSMVDDSTS